MTRECNTDVVSCFVTVLWTFSSFVTACLGFNSANDQCPEEEAEQHDALNQSMEKERCRHFHAGPLCAGNTTIEPVSSESIVH